MTGVINTHPAGNNSAKGAQPFSEGSGADSLWFRDHPCLTMRMELKEAAGKLYLLQDPEILLPMLIMILKYAELPLFSSKSEPSFTSAILSSLSLCNSSLVFFFE